MYRRLVVAVAALTLSPCAALAQTTRTVLDGVYTAEQAARGGNGYVANCKVCHEGLDQDGPDLTGSAFVDRWREDKLDVLFTFMRTNMPGNQPGRLSENTYVDVLAFLLQGNGFPAGSKELTADAIASIQLVGKDGPKPLSNMTVVRMVGCLITGPNDAWILTNASDPVPVRTRNVNQTTLEELKDSEARPLGTQTFRLQNVPNSADANKGHKVQAKGVLIRQTNNNRINIMSLETVASSCGQ